MSTPVLSNPVWDPARYLAFASVRLQPALDLLARVDLAAPARIVDLGCGAGNVTRLLAMRWPDADILGLDGSPEMLAKAAETASPNIRWQCADIGSWTPDGPVDLIFSNAALHWLDAHRTLFLHLFSQLAPGGVLAAQMPRNHGAPSHALMIEAARAGRWRTRLEPLLRAQPVQPPEVYYDLLAAVAGRLDIWETEYIQALDGDDPVVAFTSGTALKPLLDALDEPDRGEFLSDYTRRVATAYPRRADGVTLFPFRRLFLLARHP